MLIHMFIWLKFSTYIWQNQTSLIFENVSFSQMFQFFFIPVTKINDECERLSHCSSQLRCKKKTEWKNPPKNIFNLQK